MQSFKEQMEVIRRGTAEIIPEDDLIKKLERSVKTGKPLCVKLGLDPTAPDIHLGHTVVLQKVRQFQELGHEIKIILGDFTARIGDPTGKSETRQQLTESEVKANLSTYEKQIFKVLDPARTKLFLNSQWLSPLTFQEVIELAAKYTIARMLEREDFNRRFKEGLPVGVHEFFYPLMQGYDSVVLKADIEIGGTDQKFNLLMGRTLQKEYGMEPQVALMMPILEGLDGVQKMSKSLGNYIGIDEIPREIYGKTMSIPDELIMRYFELVTPLGLKELSEISADLKSGKLHPRDAKMRLAYEIVSFYHDEYSAKQAEEEFKKVFQQRELPDQIPVYEIKADILQDGSIWLPRLMVLLEMAASTSEGRRLITQGAVKINGIRIEEPAYLLVPQDNMIVQCGKRKFSKLKV
ncbi:MAG TPA: tyrosine--tRNA ligase [Desulfotomaculum sp.]|nr:MAG: Tyrosine--tRNA ligase [Desulfotomaculum sp. 46_80]KUK85048.1 MAG: Tyrosine--tRNA ligase [Desulfofundulus kuznetsovii]HAG10927.1 tyrosine--tRNA ligase [Desulfotomaculum sp.]HBY03966.1 tyrosine--tRNA ligase [Desulfotomaculum sp.]